MKKRTASIAQLRLTVFCAFLFWALIFGFELVNFWFGLSVAACILMAMSIKFAGLPMASSEINLTGTCLAVLSAASLYAIFKLSKDLSAFILPFADTQVAGIYTIEGQASPFLIAMVLLFITSPAEEIFWRGFLQRHLMRLYSPNKGWLLATALYAAVHVASGNLMLTGAAMVAGLFWGYLYLRLQSLYICILSHAIWTVSIFLIWPVR